MMTIRDLIHKTICTNLLKIRLYKRYSQERIATVLEIKQSSYNKMEGGQTRISSEQLGILAEFYKINVGAFYTTDIDFNVNVENLSPVLLKIKEDLENQKLLVNLLVKRNEELEEKVSEKELVIDGLLNQPIKNNEIDR